MDGYLVHWLVKQNSGSRYSGEEDNENGGEDQWEDRTWRK